MEDIVRNYLPDSLWNITFEYAPCALIQLFKSTVLAHAFNFSEYLLRFIQPATFNSVELFSVLLARKQCDVIEWLLYCGLRPPISFMQEYKSCYPFLKLLIEHNILQKNDLIAFFKQVCRLTQPRDQVLFLDLLFKSLDISDFVGSTQIEEVCLNNGQAAVVKWLYYHGFEITGTQDVYQLAFFKAALHANYSLMRFLTNECGIKSLRETDFRYLRTHLDTISYNNLIRFLNSIDKSNHVINKRRRLY